MVGEQKLQSFPAGIQYLWGVGFNFHAFTDGVYTGCHQASGSFHFHHADAAGADLVDLLQKTESGNLNMGQAGRFQDGRALWGAYFYAVNFDFDCIHSDCPPLLFVDGAEFTFFHAGSALDTFRRDGAVWTVSGTERTALTFGRINVVREQSLADTGWTTLLFDMCLVFATEIMQSGKYRVWSGLSQST